MISIVIPAYLQPGHGGKMLVVLLNSILLQECSVPYEIIVSDNDDTGAITGICNRYIDVLPIRCVHNPVKGASENFNRAFDLATYDLIKPMCMDDAFYSKNGLQAFSDTLKDCGWCISNSVHINEQGHVYSRRFTQYNHNQMEQNITGMPSVIGFKKCDLRFDLRLKTFMDTFFYYQLYEMYGPPKIITTFAVACRFWGGSLSHNQVSNKKADLQFLRQNKMIKC